MSGWERRGRGLSLMQQFCGMGDAAQFGDLDEGPQADNVHTHTFFTY
jgi:hypothetical protein